MKATCEITLSSAKVLHGLLSKAILNAKSGKISSLNLKEPSYALLKVRLHVRSWDREVCLFYYVQIAIGDFYYAQLCAKLCECARAIRSALRRNRSRSDLRFQLRANAD